MSVLQKMFTFESQPYKAKNNRKRILILHAKQSHTHYIRMCRLHRASRPHNHTPDKIDFRNT